MKKTNFNFDSATLSPKEMTEVLGGLRGGGCTAEALCGDGHTVSCQGGEYCHAVDGPNGYVECGLMTLPDGTQIPEQWEPCQLI